MRTKVTLVLIFLNVALFFFIFKFERNWRTEAASLEARRRVLGPEAADIRTLEVTSTSGPSFTLVRQRDTWMLTQPLDWPANPHAASSIVHELQLLENETSFAVADLAKNQQSLADYGLDRPKLTVSFTSGDPVGTAAAPRPATRLAIGDTTRDGRRLYVLSPDQQRVHVVPRSLVDTLSVPLEQLRAETLLSVRVFEARSLSIQTSPTGDGSRGGTAGVRVRIRRDATRWSFETPIIARASKTAVELAISELNALQPRTFSPAVPPATLPSVSPRLRITIEGNNRHETLFLGDPIPPAEGAAPAADNRGVEHYAQLDGREALFTVAVPRTLLDSLRQAQEALRERRILDFDAAAVSAITLAAPLQSDRSSVTLQRLETAPGQPRGSEPAWQVVFRAGSATNPQTAPAELAAIRSLLDRLTLLSADQFKSDAPTSADLEDWGFNRPVRQVTLTFAGNTPPLVLRLGTDAGRQNTYARVGTEQDPGNSIYTVDPAILGVLDPAPHRWRDRAVGEPLPGTTRITALKLTDRSINRPLAEARFEADGTPVDTTADPTALRTIAAALRSLRAREFVPGGFAERPPLSQDVPWRFQLEATLTSPGIAGLEQTRTLTLLLTERLGGNEQYAGSSELDAVFSLEQPVIDALWKLAYGDRDPGPPPPRQP